MIGERAAASADSRRLLARAADALVAYPFSCWHYGDSIGFEGLLAASEILEDQRYFGFAYGFMRAWAASGPQMSCCAMRPWGGRAF